MSDLEFGIEVSGDFACFTRQEMKAERFSYSVMTPSAARAVFEAVLWKPAIQWLVTRIEVMNPIRFTSIKRNELNHTISPKTVKSMMANKGGDISVDAGSTKHRMPRHSVILRDVRYRIYAKILMTDKAGPRDNYNKFVDMFTRRLKSGQCFYQPYLGCREFSADFSAIEDPSEAPISTTEDLGFMLLDMDFTNPKKPTPLFFEANMVNGVIEIPPRVIPGVAA